MWDAEDLSQDVLLRGFAALGRPNINQPVVRFEKPEAYLGQIATNLWIDRVRRTQREAPILGDPPAPANAAPVITHAAGAALFDRTAPQERAALVLKDVFDFSLEEIATILATSVNAVKARDTAPARN